LGEQILRLAQYTGDPVIFLVAHSLLGAPFLSLGEFTAAREHLQKGIGLYDPREHGFMASLYGDDPGVTCHSFVGLTLWFLGYADQALTNVRQALTVAEESGNPYSKTFALDFVTWIHVLRREEPAAQEAIGALTRIATEHGFPFLLADCGVLHGWVLAAQGSTDEGLQQVQRAIAAYEATGAVMSRPSHFVLLAKVCGKAGQIEDALAALAQAEAAMDQSGERSYEAERHRLQGELILDRAYRASRKRQIARAAAAE